MRERLIQSIPVFRSGKNFRLTKSERIFKDNLKIKASQHQENLDEHFLGGQKSFVLRWDIY